MNPELHGISVVIPVFNRVELLPATLGSLLQQSVPADEIIIVDDGSTDGTAELAESYGAPVRVIRQCNQGPAAARNRGFAESRGEFIHFFDSDDIACPNKHEVQLKVLHDSGADIAYSPWLKGEFNGNVFKPGNLVFQQHGLPEGDLAQALLACWSTIPHACLFRREILERVGGFPEHLSVAEDQLMFLNCLLADAKVIHSPDTLLLYRDNNADKITARPEAARIRLTHWARFLLEGAGRCVANGKDPMSWSGFQQRVWHIRRELRIVSEDEPQDKDVVTRIRDLKLPRPGWFYWLQSLILKKAGGLQVRLTGGRANRSFRLGKLTPLQKTLIGRLGYNLKG
jgi:glycosyltransferase involved in cell wall biosynthesis